MDTIDLVLLYDYYGDLLTDRQKECFELRHYQDLSLGEIASELGISRQGVHDALHKAQKALEDNEWDLLDAMVALEKSGKTDGPKQQQYSTSYDEQKAQLQMATGYTDWGDEA